MGLIINLETHKQPAYLGDRKVRFGSLSAVGLYPSGGFDLAIPGMAVEKIILDSYAFQSLIPIVYNPVTKKMQVYYARSGDFITNDIWYAITNLTSTPSPNTDQVTAPGEFAISYTAVSGGAWSMTDPGGGAWGTYRPQQCIMVIIKNDTGGPLNMFEGAMTFTITGHGGINLGGGVSPITDTVVFTSTAGNKSIADGRFRYAMTTKPFNDITSITLDNVPDNGLKIGLGGTSKRMYINYIGDTLHGYTNWINGTPQGIPWDATNKVLDWGNLTQGDSIVATYRASGNLTTLAEIPVGTDFGAGLDSIGFMAVGR